MRKSVILFVVMMVLVILVLPAQTKPMITVLPFTANKDSGVSKADAAALSVIFEVTLINTGEYQVLEQTQIAAILETQAFSLSGCVDESCAVEIGKLLSADTIIIGSLNKIASRYILTTKMVSVELGEIVGGDIFQGNNLEEIIDQLIAKISDTPGSSTNSKSSLFGGKSADPGELLFIEGGTFQMGSLEGDSDEILVHDVSVNGFTINKYETTVGEFREFINASGYKTTAETSGGAYVFLDSNWQKKSDADWENPYFNQNENSPVSCVSWYDAINYCNWLSEKEGLTAAYQINGNNVNWNKNANGYRLPTEAEWEFAAGGGTENKGYSYSGSNTLGYVAWIKNNSLNETHPPGEKGGNELGLFDMSGNVLEWCWDLYGDYPSIEQDNPTGAEKGIARIYRGGSWSNNDFFCRITNRTRVAPDRAYANLGFRLVRSVHF